MDKKKQDEQNASAAGIDTELAGRYRLSKELGRGANSIVYQAHDKMLDREIAVKVLNIDDSEDASKTRERFRREAHAASMLNHPNIVQVYAFESDEKGKAIIAMELVHGQTLEQIFKTQHILDRSRFESIFLPVIEALEFAHSKKIVHRDIKPANIMINTIDSRQQVKVLDFGIARDFSSDQSASLTMSPIGTPLYMSPEQCAQKTADLRSDIYSLACVMYESLAGRPPFLGDSVAQTMYMHINDAAPLLDDISGARQIPAQLVEAVLSGLSKDPNLRPASMSEFKALIQRSLDSTRYLRRKKPLQMQTVWTVTAIALLSVPLGFSVLKKYIEERTQKDKATVQLIKKPQHLNYQEVFREASRLRLNGKAQESIDELLKLERFLGQRGNRETQTVLYYDLGQSYVFLGDTERDKGGNPSASYSNGLEAYRKAETLLPDQTTRMAASVKSEIIRNLLSLGKQKEAKFFIDKYSIQIQKGGSQIALAEYLTTVGAALAGNKQPKAAIPYLLKALSVFDQMPEKRANSTAAVASSELVACSELANENPERAKQEFNKTREDLLQNEQKEPIYARGLATLANTRYWKGDLKDSLYLYRKAVSGILPTTEIDRSEVNGWKERIASIERELKKK